MIESITVYQKSDKSDAFTMVLSNPTNVTPKIGLAIEKIEGLGPVEAEINMTEMVNDGDVYNSSRIGKRNIVIDLIFYSEVGNGIEEARKTTYALFPIKKLINIEVKEKDTSGSYHTYKTQGYVEKNEPDIFSSESKSQISILCPDPKWYDAENVQTTEIEPGNLGRISYAGDVPVGGYLEITIDSDIPGPIASGVPVFTLYTNDTFENHAIEIYNPSEGFLAGEVLTICSIPGNKSCILTDVAEADNNALNLLNKDPYWITLNKGINTISIDSSIPGLLEIIGSITFTNPICYEGV